jgi:hypothetical protein
MRRREFIAGLGAAITGSIPTDAQELSRLLLVSSGKRIQLDDETWHALNQLANDRVARLSGTSRRGLRGPSPEARPAH